jgi:hypothetical protein
MGNINSMIPATINSVIMSIANFIPRFISGLIVLLIGIILATFLKQILLELFKFIKLETMLKKYGIPESEGVNWSNILSELVRWFVIVLFLVPTADVWGLGRFTEILNNLLLYLPNVFIAVLLLLVGFAVAKLVHDLLRASIHNVSPDIAKTIALVGRWAVLIFVALVALNQLGIASDLIRILFTGIVAMFAIAGGLAFGLGGQESARDLLDKLRKKS